MTIQPKDNYLALSLPGGATKGAGIAGAAVAILDEGYRPNLITGISFGAVACVPLALGMHSELLIESRNIRLRDFFTLPPTTKGGSINPIAALRALSGFFVNWALPPHKKIISFGKQDIRPILSKFVTPKAFDKYQSSDLPDCYVMAAHYTDKKAYTWNLKDRRISYNEYLSIVRASSMIPVATQGIWLPKSLLSKAIDQKQATQKGDSALFFDGGLIHHNLGAYITKQVSGIKHLISIHSRPKNFEIPPIALPKNVFDTALGTIENLKVQVSRNDEDEEIDQSIQQGFLLDQIFLNWIVEDLYGTGQDLTTLQQDAIRIVEQHKFKAPPIGAM